MFLPHSGAPRRTRSKSSGKSALEPAPEPFLCTWVATKVLVSDDDEEGSAMSERIF